MRRLALIAAVGLLLLGLGCLNYTTAGGEEHHSAWSGKHGMPEPGVGIFALGVLGTVLGAGSLGYALGRVRR